MKISISKLLLNSLNNLLIDINFAILYILKLNQQIIYSLVLINSGTFGYRFIVHSYMLKYNIPMILLNTSRTLEPFDKNFIKYRQIIHIA